MTTQDLKDNRIAIIERVKELGCEDKMKSFMDIMVMDAPFHKGTVEELINEVYNTHFRATSRKNSVVAEAAAKAQEANGTYEYGNFGKEYANRKFGK